MTSRLPPVRALAVSATNTLLHELVLLPGDRDGRPASNKTASFYLFAFVQPTQAFHATRTFGHTRLDTLGRVSFSGLFLKCLCFLRCADSFMQHGHAADCVCQIQSRNVIPASI